MKTIGHNSVHGGLRGHSIGDTYPIGVYAQGLPDSLQWVVWNAITGVVHNTFNSSAKAHAAAKFIAGV